MLQNLPKDGPSIPNPQGYPLKKSEPKSLLHWSLLRRLTFAFGISIAIWMAVLLAY